ncbi:sodium:proton antiporter NhaD [Hallella bergensis]|uniref:sodium:proton antiporter NhaD n=1 Tax=Hallella bergensis TaxID=242750 RepID=UPI003990BA60
MSTLTIAIIITFCIGYLLIAIESITKINKAAIALLMFAACWSLFMISPESYIQGFSGQELVNQVSTIIERHLGTTSTTLFFLMGAMTIVEIVDQNGGFNWVRSVLQTQTKRALLWRIAFLTFVLSPVLDNLTTSIVMVMILRKLIHDHKDRMIYASIVIIAANSGGAFSPIGDVTTIMLWNMGAVTALGVISELFIPSLVSMVVPAFIMQYMLKGNLDDDKELTTPSDYKVYDFSHNQRKAVFAIGVGGLLFVPVFKSITQLPPFVGILLVLSVLWVTTEVFYRGLHPSKEREGTMRRVAHLLRNIDMSTILFFLGILMAVACLQETGVLIALGDGLNVVFNSNHYAVTGVIGVFSSIVDNVPLVAGCMGMYPIEAAGDMAVDGIFWQLLAYCAGVGGSILIIGSAPGVVVMGLEKITFGWYLKHIAWIAFVGYILGILAYWVVRTYIFTVPL